jgi:hypothetical protein
MLGVVAVVLETHLEELLGWGAQAAVELEGPVPRQVLQVAPTPVVVAVAAGIRILQLLKVVGVMEVLE